MTLSAAQNVSDVLIRTTGLSRVHRKGNREVHALKDADLVVNQGEYLAIVGPSGSGKSTLLSLLGLLDRPSAGSYELAGMDVASLADRSASTIRNQMIGFVFQSFHLIPHLSAWRNAALPLEYSPLASMIPISERRQLALAALESVGMLEHAEHLPRELSGGQEQRVAVARALVGSPSLILADEPTGNLDSNSRDDILSLFEQANERGVTVIIITHDQDVAARAHRQVRLTDGRIVQ